VTDNVLRSGILVGYDGSDHSIRALDWAALEARRHDAPLVVCTVVPDATPDPRLYGTRWAPNPDVKKAAQRLLDQARARVAGAAPDVPVACTALLESPARGLVKRADRAEMVVVGSRGRGGVASMLLGSVSLHVAAHAPCPVVVVPAHDQAPLDGARGLVVVGYDGAGPAEAALAFAATEAALRGATLTVVHAWQHPHSVIELPVIDADRRQRDEERARDLVLQALEPWAAKYPDLEIKPAFTREPPAAHLISQSASADLLVVGSHGHDPFTGLLLGSVSHAAAQAARCPVAIVRWRP
jgi:nucleotide-binding universal stress UspA family protein